LNNSLSCDNVEPDKIKPWSNSEPMLSFVARSYARFTARPVVVFAARAAFCLTLAITLEIASALTFAQTASVAAKYMDTNPTDANPTKTNPKDGLTYVWIPPGKFTMGCAPKDAECFDNEKRVHEVTITAGFWIGQTDVTQEAYTRVNGKNPSHFKGAKSPVETVNWAEAQNYCEAIGGRLPTEAEWEYAARGGNPNARYGPATEIAWYRDGSGGKTRSVAQEKPNAYGLFDMLGNVWQWTADWYGDYPTVPVSDPVGPGPSNGRILRGGSWSDHSRFIRASEREAAPPGDRYDTIGFRCVVIPAFAAGDQAFLASGGSGSVDLTIPAGSAWSAVSSESWIRFTDSASGVGSGSLRYQVAPNPGAHRSATVTVGNSSFTVEQQAGVTEGLSFKGSMPDTVAQENWKTTFTFVNKGDTPAEARLNLFEDPGGPLTLPLTFPGRPAVLGPVRGAGLDRTLAPHASLVIESAGPQTPPLRIGSAQLAGTGAVDGFAIFELIPGAQEAVVPLETRHAKSYLLAFDNTGGVGLGVAVANVSTEPSNIGVIIRDDTGVQIQTGTLALAGSGHTSFVLSAQYPATANKRGTIELDAPPDGHISALGLRTTPLITPQGTTTTITTIPVLADIGKGGGSIAHIASGNGWQTTFVLINTGVSPARADLAFFDDNGAPLPLPVEVPQSTGSLNSPASSVHRTIEAGATLLVRSVAPLTDPAPTIGSAQLSTDGNVGGFVIFRFNPNGQEAVVPLENRNAPGYILAYDNTNGIATGVAVNSVSAQAVNIPVVIRDEAGAQVGTGSVPLAANGHSAFILATQFPQTFDRRGTIVFNAPAGAQIGVLGIRTPMTHTFTTLPALAK
jgi:formylglycine-generating enzyme required for sulfatase activity